eukprot:PhF_6_TR6926/c0_g1_i3/m.10114
MEGIPSDDIFRLHLCSAVPTESIMLSLILAKDSPCPLIKGLSFIIPFDMCTETLEFVAQDVAPLCVSLIGLPGAGTTTIAGILYEESLRCNPAKHDQVMSTAKFYNPTQPYQYVIPSKQFKQSRPIGEDHLTIFESLASIQSSGRVVIRRPVVYIYPPSLRESKSQYFRSLFLADTAVLCISATF